MDLAVMQEAPPTGETAASLHVSDTVTVMKVRVARHQADRVAMVTDSRCADVFRKSLVSGRGIGEGW